MYNTIERLQLRSKRRAPLQDTVEGSQLMSKGWHHYVGYQRDVTVEVKGRVPLCRILLRGHSCGQREGTAAWDTIERSLLRSKGGYYCIGYY